MKRVQKYWAYGGDFGPANVPSDNNFCNNGLISPTGVRIQPCMK